MARKVLVIVGLRGLAGCQSKADLCSNLIGTWGGADNYAERKHRTQWTLWRKPDFTWTIRHDATDEHGEPFVQIESGILKCSENVLTVNVQKVNGQPFENVNVYRVVKANPQLNVLEILSGIDEVGMQFTAHRNEARKDEEPAQAAVPAASHNPQH